MITANTPQIPVCIEHVSGLPKLDKPANLTHLPSLATHQDNSRINLADGLCCDTSKSTGLNVCTAQEGVVVAGSVVAGVSTPTRNVPSRHTKGAPHYSEP